MTHDTEAPRPWVEVMDKTFVLAVTDETGKPVRLTYPIREHLGESLTPLPGGLKIVRVPQDVEREGERYRVRAEEIVINAAQIVAIETTYRLERRERLSVQDMMKIGVEDAEAAFRKAQAARQSTQS
jgi:hypothetical protein